MRFRDQIALNLPSFVLRVMLAATFIWAGLGKIVETAHVGPEQAARLATIGVPVAPAVAPTSAPADAAPTTPGVRLPEPADAAPEGAQPKDEPADQPADAVPDEAGEPSAPDAQLPDPDGGSAALMPPPAMIRPASFRQDAGTTRSLTDRPPAADEGAKKPETTPEDDEPAGTTGPTPAPPVETAPKPESKTGPAPETHPESAPAPAPAPAFTAADFPQGADVRKVVLLALVMDRAANPPLDAESNQPEPFWPGALAGKPWPNVLAWSVALTELIGGVLMLVGLFTRLGALGLASVMVGAMWLTQIGPAMQSGDTVLGFLPNYPAFDPGAWMPLMWQFSLLAASLAVFLLGSGAIGIDRALFRGSRYHAYDTGPTYAPAGEFDRTPREPKP